MVSNIHFSPNVSLFGSGNIDTFGIKLLYQNEDSEYLGRYCKYQSWGF